MSQVSNADFVPGCLHLWDLDECREGQNTNVSKGHIRPAAGRLAVKRLNISVMR